MVMAASASAHMWFIKTGGEVWGPYAEGRVAAFCREGRVRAATLVSPFAAGPWSAAAEAHEFAALFRAGVAPAPAPPVERPAPPRGDARVRTPGRTTSAAPAPVAALRPEPAAEAERVLLVFAELTSVAPAAFHAGLERLGGCIQVRSGLWLLRAPVGAASLRNRLSAHLGAKDTLLVVEAPLDQAAWFNLAPVDDRDLRRLWSG